MTHGLNTLKKTEAAADLSPSSISTQEIEISKLTLLDSNPRKVKKEAIARLAKSLNSPRGRELFQKRPVLVNERDGKLVVYAGNQRLRAAQSLGWTTVPCIVDQISLQEEREETVKDNLVIGEWDSDLLGKDFDMKDLDSWGLDLADLRLDLGGPEELGDIPLPQATARAQLGRVYALGRHRVMCGDSANKAHVGALMGEHKASMVFTDPPYGVDYEKKAVEILGRKDRAVVTGDDMGKEVLETVVFGAFTNIEALLADGGKYYVCSPQGGELCLMMMMMMKAGIECRHTIVWKKDSPVFSMGRLDYEYQHEPILYGWKGSHKHYAHGDFKTSIWEVKRPRVSKLHPTMKPVELVQNAILNSTLKDELVLDLFLGSGTTLIASEQTGRICYGMEIDPKYVDVIIERFCNYTGADKEAIYEAAK